MATPMVAGAAVIVREYFMRGFYPGGYESSSDAFVPSGALIKAMLVHSAQNVPYSLDHNGATVSIGTAPSNTVGYGRIELDKILNVGASSSKHVTLFVVGAAFKQSQEAKNAFVNDCHTFDYVSYKQDSKVIHFILLLTTLK
jgi:hypothetical protein